MSDAPHDNPAPQRRAFISRLSRFLGVVLALFAILALFDYSCVTIYDGGYELTIHVETSGPKPSAVGCMAVWRQDEAERTQERIKNSSPRCAFESCKSVAVADPFQGENLKVWIRLSDRESFFGRPLSQGQNRFLVVLAEWPDGHRVCKVVEIPEGRVSKEVTVSLP